MQSMYSTAEHQTRAKMIGAYFDPMTNTYMKKDHTFLCGDTLEIIDGRYEDDMNALTLRMMQGWKYPLR